MTVGLRDYDLIDNGSYFYTEYKAAAGRTGPYLVQQCVLPHAENGLVSLLSCREGSEKELRVKI